MPAANSGGGGGGTGRKSTGASAPRRELTPLGNFREQVDAVKARMFLSADDETSAFRDDNRANEERSLPPTTDQA